MLEYGKSGIYNNNRLPAEKKKEEEKENTRDRSVPDGSDKHIHIKTLLFEGVVNTNLLSYNFKR